LTPIIFIGVMLLLVWLLLIAPQRRRQQAQRRMLEDVNVGDEVLTAGGMYATVREVRGDDLTVEIAPGTNIRLDKRAVALVLSSENADEDEDEDYVEEPDALEPAVEQQTAPDEEPSQAGRT
jgi:preprotein translocase subunit YajC